MSRDEHESEETHYIKRAVVDVLDLLANVATPLELVSPPLEVDQIGSFDDHLVVLAAAGLSERVNRSCTRSESTSTRVPRSTRTRSRRSCAHFWAYRALKSATQEKLPVLGICRGAQLINMPRIALALALASKSAWELNGWEPLVSPTP